jgi:glyoxylate/hydroxypyruvate reductase A
MSSDAEPLACHSPLWTHPKITITPHNAALSDTRSIVLNMLKQIERFERGQSFENVANRDTGY